MRCERGRPGRHLGGVAPDRFFDRGRLQGFAEDGLGLAAGRIVPAQGHHRDVQSPGEGAVNGELGKFPAVDAILEDRASGNRMVQDGRGRARPRVVTDKDAGVEGLVEPLHHLPALGRAGDEIGPRVQVVGVDVPHASVGIVDHDLRRARGESALDRGVGVLGHPFPGPAVFRVVRRRLLARDDSPDALHVDGNEDLEGRLGRRLGAPGRDRGAAGQDRYDEKREDRTQEPIHETSPFSRRTGGDCSGRDFISLFRGIASPKTAPAAAFIAALPSPNREMDLFICAATAACQFPPKPMTRTPKDWRAFSPPRSNDSIVTAKSPGRAGVPRSAPVAGSIFSQLGPSTIR